MSLTATENQLLWGLGQGFLDYVAELTTYVFWYGIFVLLFATSVTLSIHRGIKGLPARIIFGATVVGFLLGTLNVGTEISGFVIFVRDALVNNADLPLTARPAIVDAELVAPNTISAWAGFLPPVISDIIVIWRAWVLFPEKSWILLFPLIFWLGTLGTTLAYLIMLSTPSGFASYAVGGGVDNIIRAAIALSVVTNGLGTGLIGWKLWSHRRFLRKDLGLESRSSPVQRILIVLIESGVVYCAFQLTYLFLTVYAPGGRGSVSWFMIYTFSATYVMLSAMYPTIILVLVNLQRSITEIGGFTTLSPGTPRLKNEGTEPQRDATFGHLSFAVGGSTSRTDLESSPSPSTPEIRNEKPGQAL